MKSLSILPMFLLLAACLSAQPQQAPPDRATAVDNIAYLIDAYAEQKYGMACLSDERLDSVFYDLIVGHDSPPDEFRRLVDSTFAQRMKSLPLYYIDSVFRDGVYKESLYKVPRQTITYSNYPLVDDRYRTGLLLQQSTIRNDVVWSLVEPIATYYKEWASLMELARAFSAIKYFYPYDSCSSNCLNFALHEAINFNFSSNYYGDRYGFEIENFYGFEHFRHLHETLYDIKEQDLVGFFLLRAGYSRIMRAFFHIERFDGFDFFPDSREQNEFSLLSTVLYKLPASINYDDSSFRISLSDAPEVSMRLDSLNDVDLKPLHRLIMSSCSGDKAAMLGSLCYRLSYSIYSQVLITCFKDDGMIKMKLRTVPISQQIENVALLRKKNRDMPLQEGRNMHLRWLPKEPEVLDSIFQVVYSGTPDTLFIETRSQYGSLRGAVRHLASGRDTFMLRYRKSCSYSGDTLAGYESILVDSKIKSSNQAKHGERKFVVCVLVDSTTSGENEMWAMLLQSQPRCLVKGRRTNGAYGWRVYYNYGYPNKYLVFPSDGIMYPDGRKLVPGGLRIDVPTK